MRRSYRWYAAAFVVGAALVALMFRSEAVREQDQWASVQSYCLDCHNAVERAGELSLVGLTAASVPEHIVGRWHCSPRGTYRGAHGAGTHFPPGEVSLDHLKRVQAVVRAAPWQRGEQYSDAEQASSVSLYEELLA